MKLLHVRIRGFRRFLTDTVLDVGNPLVALVGPNEAGKSTILEALESLNYAKPITVTGPKRQLTRGVESAQAKPRVVARFALGDRERSLLSAKLGRSDARYIDISITGDAGRSLSLIPSPQRRDDMVRARLRKALADAKLELAELGVDAAPVLKALSREPGIQGMKQAKEYAELQEKLSALEERRPESVSQDVIGDLEWMQELYARSPEKAVEVTLSGQIPRFLSFTHGDRDLKSAYDLSSFFAPGGKAIAEIPIALQNLTKAGGLSLKMLHAAVISNDRGDVQTMVDAARGRLNAILGRRWKQGRIDMAIDVDGTVVNIAVKSEGAPFVQLEERSEGLRQFVALASFLECRKENVPPILLIDEIEQHLHYDAQADVIQMLESQSQVEKIVYSTHSVGALPSDLGNGVRLVRPVQSNGSHSAVDNWFWSSSRDRYADSTGLSPMLFGMGAMTLSFVPIRAAVIMEGPSDFLLAPTLLREAVGLSVLPYQVAPGAASASRTGLAVLAAHSASTVYLLDGDAAGRKIARRLKRSGVDVEMIITLTDQDGGALILEDLIEPEVLAESIAQEMGQSSKGVPGPSAQDLPERNRWQWLTEWCASNELSVPKKTRIAYRVLQQRGERKLVAPWCARLLAEIHGRIMSAIGVK